MTTDNTSETFRGPAATPATANALEAAEIVNPFPIQALALPVALAGNDVIGQARTGTGKTLAFGVPLLQRTILSATEQRDKRASALVVVPTRELCVQVTNDLTRAGRL